MACALGPGSAVAPIAAAASASADSNPNTAWVTFNKQQKAKARAWLSTEPRDHRIVILLSLALGVTFLRVVEHLASERWQISTLNACMQAGAYNCRALAVWEGVLQLSVTKSLASACNRMYWRCLRPLGQTIGNACRSFSILFTTYCALEQLCLFLTRAFPLRSFSLIRDPSVASLILNTPRCLLDEFPDSFLSVSRQSLNCREQNAAAS